jgi:hypothetical protein
MRRKTTERNISPLAVLSIRLMALLLSLLTGMVIDVSSYREAMAADQTSPPTATAPLTLAQATDNICVLRCNFDYDTCVQAINEQYQKLRPFLSLSTHNAQLNGCRTLQRYCYRECDRP